MRITTANSWDRTVNSLQNRQEELARSQEQLISGKRVLRASDDPAAAARAERALAVQSRYEAQQRALDASRTAVQLSESTLGQAGELLQQARDLVLAAGNASYTDAERQTAAETIRGLRDELFALSNRADGTGRYLFGGQGSDVQPFVDGPGGVTFNAAPGELRTAVGNAVPLTMDGQRAWLQVPDPLTPGATVSVFDALDQTVSELSTPGRTSAQVAQTVSEGLGRIDASANHLSALRSAAGESLNRLDGIEQRMAQGTLDAQTERSSAEDLDMIQAISDFQSRQTGYDAALKAYSSVQSLSLFNYLR